MSRRPLVGGLLALLMVAGCGDDDDAATTDITEAVATATTAPQTPDTTQPTGTAATTSPQAPDTSGSVAAVTTAPETAPSTEVACEPATGEPYKVGALIDQTGALSALSLAVEKGLVARADELNACGGIDGHPIELVIKDGQSDPTTAVSAAREFADEDVLVIVGPLSGTTAIAVQPVVTAAGIPAITQQGGTILDNSGYMFGQNINPETVMHEYVQYILDHAGPNIGVIYAANALGQSSIELLRPIVDELGGNLVGEQAVDPAGNDFTTQLSALKSAGADAVYGLVSGAPAVVTATGFKALDMDGFLLVQNLSVDQLGLFGDAYDVAILPQPKVTVYDQLKPDDPYYEVTQEYAAWAKEHDVAIDLFGADGYDAIDIIVDSIHRAGPDRKAIFDLWNSGFEWFALSGPLKWSVEDHQGVGWGYAWTKIDPNGPNGPRLVIIEE